MSAFVLVVAATAPELRGAEQLDGVELLACGVGPVDAGIAVADRLAREPRPGAILHVGIAGMRRNSGLAIGDLVIGTAAHYCDTASALVTSAIEPDLRLAQRIARAFPDAHLRPIATSADVGGTAASECEVEAMEGFAVLRAAALADIPAVEVRAISNEVEEDDRALWRFADALAALEAAVPAMVAAASISSDADD